jgi:S-adenosylmethionine-diacylgycerolhomoserine-N-methlytransferase
MNGAHMDAIYRVQRHFYDLTRKPYLLGRDVMIAGLAVPQGGTVLEIGCGTARNLLCISRRYPSARCFGVDVSSVMLQTARASITRQGAGSKVQVALADATDFDPVSLFGVARFDRVVISYALSMIPEWDAAFVAAAGLLAPGGSLHVADFGDQHGLPGWFRKGLFAGLEMFSVTPRLDLAERADGIARALGHDCRFRHLYRGYAALAELRAA